MLAVALAAADEPSLPVPKAMNAETVPHCEPRSHFGDA